MSGILNENILRSNIFCSFHPSESICLNFQSYVSKSDFNENRLYTSTCVPSVEKEMIRRTVLLNQSHSPCRIDFGENFKIYFERVDFNGQPDETNFILFNGKDMKPLLFLGLNKKI